jgi:hypothetical protein
MNTGNNNIFNCLVTCGRCGELGHAEADCPFALDEDELATTHSHKPALSDVETPVDEFIKKAEKLKQE